MFYENIFRVIDDSGTLVTLPYDLTLPVSRYAHYFASPTAPPNLKRFTVGRVFRYLHLLKFHNRKDVKLQVADQKKFR